MTKRIILAALLAVAASPTLSQAVPPVPPTSAPAPKDDLVRVALETEAGRIVLALDRGRAPVTTANFLRYVDGKRFGGQTFYRALKMGDGGLIQGGVRTDARKLFPPVAHERTSQTGLKNVAGAISMANAGAGTARADFFILASDIPSLDATADQPGFAAFGRVVEGKDVVKAILAAPVSPTDTSNDPLNCSAGPAVTNRPEARSLRSESRNRTCSSLGTS